MTNEEALAHFKNHEYMTDFSWQDEMSEVAISAIEKQIPKKPCYKKVRVIYDSNCNNCKTKSCTAKEMKLNRKYGGCVNYVEEEPTYLCDTFCPACDMHVQKDWNNYCARCGRRICWEEGE